MAHFIKLTINKQGKPAEHINIDTIASILPDEHGSIIYRTKYIYENKWVWSHYIETPDQIFALIAEAQGAK